MDEFAQTRGAEDLFDDDFTPVAAPQEVITQPATEPTAPLNAPTQPSASRGPRQTHRAREPSKKSTPTPTGQQNSDAAQQAQQSQPGEETPQKVAAVRGDRSATGGVVKVVYLLLALLLFNITRVEIDFPVFVCSQNSQKKSSPPKWPRSSSRTPSSRPRTLALKQTKQPTVNEKWPHKRAEEPNTPTGGRWTGRGRRIGSGS